jgi:hypothetical protein
MKLESQGGYPQLTKEQIVSGRDYMQKQLHNFAIGAGSICVASDILVDFETVDRITRRIDQRLHYYRYFHNIDLHQLDRASLYAYWILRYRPLSNTAKHKAYDLNVCFAFRLLLGQAISTQKSVFDKFDDGVKKAVLKKVMLRYESKYRRAFNEHDITKEAMVYYTKNLNNAFLLEIKEQLQNAQ